LFCTGLFIKNKTFMRLKFYLILVIFITVNYSATAQDYFGYSNFGGITSAISNPSNIAASRYRVNLNLISTNFYIGTNMYQLQNKKFFSFNFNGLQEGTDYSKIDNGETKHFTANVDYLGPSVLFNINKKIAIGLTTRLRTMMNLDNLSNNSFNVFSNTNTNLYDHNFTENNVGYNVHSFADFGLVYAQQLYKTSQHDVKVGVTLKLVKGIAAGTIYINKVNVLNLKNADTITQVNGNFDVAYSKNAEGLLTGDMTAGFSQISSSDAGTDLAADLGVVYEYKNNKKYPYQFRVGLSVTDLSFASLTYKNGSQGGNYDINKANTSNILTSSVAQLPGESYTQYLQRLSSLSTPCFLTVVVQDSAKDFTMNLPTALHLNADIHIIKNYYVNAYFLFNLIETNKKGSNYYTSTYIVSPRFDKKWFSLFVPLSYNSLSEFNWGLGAKFGPLFIGSGSVFSNLLKNNVHNTDLKLSLSIPIFRSYKSTQE